MYLQEPEFVDDFGEAYYIGHYTERLVKASECSFFGAVIPQANCRYVDHAVLGKQARKDSFRTFADSEANCNTCKHLVRVPHEKSRDGFLRGQCLNRLRKWEAHPYVNSFAEYGCMIFHPDDPMHMPCYESRW